jgi:hypothetical protein
MDMSVLSWPMFPIVLSLGVPVEVVVSALGWLSVSVGVLPLGV